MSGEQYLEALANCIAVEKSKQRFLEQFHTIYSDIKA